MTSDEKHFRVMKTGVTFFGSVILILTMVGMYGCPHYNVWSANLEGSAELARAQQNRKIAVLEAQAKMDSAKLFADAEVARARGVAEANKIIAGGLKGNDEYLRYLWIEKVAASTGGREVIYVPTEASLPILEARTPSRSGK